MQDFEGFVRSSKDMGLLTVAALRAIFGLRRSRAERFAMFVSRVEVEQSRDLQVLIKMSKVTRWPHRSCVGGINLIKIYGLLAKLILKLLNLVEVLCH